MNDKEFFDSNARNTDLFGDDGVVFVVNMFRFSPQINRSVAKCERSANKNRIIELRRSIGYTRLLLCFTAHAYHDKSQTQKRKETKEKKQHTLMHNSAITGIEFACEPHI